MPSPNKKLFPNSLKIQTTFYRLSAQIKQHQIEIDLIIAIITFFKTSFVATAGVRPQHSFQIEIKDAFSIAE